MHVGVGKDKDGRNWMTWTWQVRLPENHPDYRRFGKWNGNHSAIYPMGSSYYLTSASAKPTEYRNIAYKRNPDIQITDNSGRTFDDGCVGHDYGDWCVAEGPDLYTAPENGMAYVTFSRNSWYDAAYATYYRFADSFGELGSTNFQENPTQPEFILTQSKDRKISHTKDADGNMIPGGKNFAGGAMFTGPGGRTYLLMHTKGGEGGWARRIYFKELHLLPNGEIQPLIEGGTFEDDQIYRPEQDLNVFLIPR